MLKETDYIIYLDSLLKGNKKECVRLVADYLDRGVSVKIIYTKILQRSMYRVGRLWEKGELSIPDERIASDITTNIIDLIYPFIAKRKNGKRIIITCIDKEHHTIGARMVSDFFELNGWKSTFLGASVPSSEVTALIKRTKPDVVGISANIYFNIARLIKLIEEIKSRNPRQEIIIGGQIFLRHNTDIIKKYKNVKYIPSMKSLESYIKRKNSSKVKTKTPHAVNKKKATTHLMKGKKYGQ